MYQLLLRSMKYLPLIVILMLAACNGNQQSPDTINHFYAPATGTVIAADSTRVTEDDLNESYFAVYITANDSSVQGRYGLHANFGFNEAESEVVYPKLTQGLTPAIRKDETMPYSYIVGFRYDDDSAFNDYLKVFATRAPGVGPRIELRYLKAYFVDTTSKK